MKQDIIVWVCIAISIAIVVGIKFWLHRLLKFKIDESAILQFLESTKVSGVDQSSNTIAAETGIDAERVSEVCTKSKVINGVFEASNSGDIHQS